MKVTLAQSVIALRQTNWGDESPLPNLFGEGFGNTYPYRFKNEIRPEIVTREYLSLVLENEFLRLTMIPGLGARVYSLWDKTTKQEVFALPATIAPTLVALRGLFCGFGMEFNFPTGHTVHAFEKIPFTITEKNGQPAIRYHIYNAVTGIDTDILLWLEPGERSLHYTVTFHNTLPVRNGMMYWANAGVVQTPETTFICKARMSHFFIEYETFPQWNGLDLRVSKNRHFGSDAFGVETQEEWFGYYTPERKLGALHFSPLAQMKGQKFWSGGFDSFGIEWGKNYHHKPYGYMEFQRGILETQMEYFGLEPFEKRVVEEQWAPFSEIGLVSHATRELIFSHEENALKVTALKNLSNVVLEVKSRSGDSRASKFELLEVGKIYSVVVPSHFAPNDYELKVTVDDKVLLDRPIRDPIPSTREEIKKKQEWLDLQPTSEVDRLEVATRHYLARRFKKARSEVTSLIGGVLGLEATRLLEEINYIENRASVELDRQELLGADQKGRHDYYSWIASLDALYSAGKPDLMLKCFDLMKSEYEREPLTSYIGKFLKINLGFATPPARLNNQKSPHTRLERLALEIAIKENSQDSEALSLLGDYWSGKDEKKAEELWRLSVEQSPANAMPLRNLAYRALRKRDHRLAIGYYERAFQAAPLCIDLIVEYSIALRMSNDHSKILMLLKSLPAERQKDYRCLKVKAYALRDLGDFDAALSCLLGGGPIYCWEGEVDHHKCYLNCLQALGVQALEKGYWAIAEEFFRKMLIYPEVLCHGKPFICNEAIVWYHLGLVAEKARQPDKAKAYFQLAVQQDHYPIHHWISYREHEYYEALAALKLGDQDHAQWIAEKRLLEGYDLEKESSVGSDFLPHTREFNRHQAAAYGYIVQGKKEEAKKAIQHGRTASGYLAPLAHAENELAKLCLA